MYMSILSLALLSVIYYSKSFLNRPFIISANTISNSNHPIPNEKNKTIPAKIPKLIIEKKKTFDLEVPSDIDGKWDDGEIVWDKFFSMAPFVVYHN